jgi:hypothetical protein
LIYVILLHFTAGTIVGSLFTVATLVVLLALEAALSVGLLCIYGPVVGLAWLANAVALQVGYLAGVYLRGLLEEAGIVQGSMGKRRIS